MMHILEIWMTNGTKHVLMHIVGIWKYYDNIQILNT